MEENNIYDIQDVNSNKAMAILAYFGILVLIPIFAAEKSKFARFHANQGLVLFLIEIGCSLLSFVPIIGILAAIVSIACTVFAIMGIVYAAQGKAQKLPLIGEWKLLK